MTLCAVCVVCVCVCALDGGKVRLTLPPLVCTQATDSKAGSEEPDAAQPSPVGADRLDAILVRTACLCCVYCAYYVAP